MDRADAELSTGIPAFDRVLSGLLPGDNLVWEVESIEDYIAFVTPFVDCALRQGRNVTYFRFAKHARVVHPDPRITQVKLDPQAGFEAFLDGVIKRSMDQDLLGPVPPGDRAEGGGKR